MTTVIQTITSPMNVTANTTTLRSFMSDFYSTLTAAGLTQRADTGQADPATLTYAATTFYHSVWNLNDGGTSIVFRFSWRTSGTSFAQLYVNIGTGTDGAGVLTGGLADFSILATPGTTPGAVNSGYVNCMGGFNGANAAAMQFMACRIAADGYFYLELVNQAQDGRVNQGGSFAFWRRKGYEASGHALSFAHYPGTNLGLLNEMKSPNTPGTGAAYTLGNSQNLGPVYIPWGRTNSEPAKVNFFPMKILFPVAATYGHETQHVMVVTYGGEGIPGDLLTINVDGDGNRTYRITDQIFQTTGSTILGRQCVLWE